MAGPKDEDVRAAVIEMLARGMEEMDKELEITGYVVLCFDRTPVGVSQVSTAMVLGPFDGEMEAVEYAVTYHEQINRGLAADDPTGWDTVVKPIVARD